LLEIVVVIVLVSDDERIGWTGRVALYLLAALVNGSLEGARAYQNMLAQSHHLVPAA